MKEEKEEPKKKDREVDVTDLEPKKDAKGGAAKPEAAQDGKVIQQERVAPFFHS